MGNLLTNFKKSLLDGFKEMVESGAYVLYGFGARHIPFVDDVPMPNDTIEENYILPKVHMMFGKRIHSTDIAPIIKNIPWQYGKIYQAYDIKKTNLEDTEYYVVCSPDVEGGFYHIFKCIENNNGGPSLYKPDQYLTTIFTKVDGYSWKYMYSISSADFTRFGNDSYVPITENNEIKSAAYDSSGIDKIVIDVPGDGYITVHSGIIRAVANSTLLQIEPSAATSNDFYNLSSIYIYNSSSQTGQLVEIKKYTSNSSGNWVQLKKSVNTSTISSGLTHYNIAPTVRISGDGDRQALAYCTVANNKISDINIIDRGRGYVTASASIIANSSFGYGANLVTIVPPGGGHGYDVKSELNVKGLAINFKFANDELGQIPVNHSYSAYGILMNPKDAANTTYVYGGNTFYEILEGAPVAHKVFTNGEIVIGQNTGSMGYVYVSNTTHLYLSGSKGFDNNEIIIGQTSGLSDRISINNRGNIYYKDCDILYIRNIPKVDRSVSQSETFKIFIEA